MKNLKACFIGLVLASLGFSAVMASANSGHVAKPNFINVLPEITIVGTVPSNVIELAPITIMGSLKATHHVNAAKSHTVNVPAVSVTDLEQGGAPGSESVIRFN